jgi:serine protease Do
MKAKRLTALLLALSLLLGSMLSLSSCSSSFKDWLDEYTKEEDDQSSTLPDDGKSDKGTADKPDDSTPPIDDDTSADGDSGVTPPLVFNGSYYPGQGSVAIEDISPKNRTLLSTVVIQTKFGSTPSSGAGVIYQLDKETGDAYVITNYHLVFSKNYGLCSSIAIYLYGMVYADYAIPATLIGGSVNYDIAVLKVSGSNILKNSYATDVTLGNSERVRVFDEVYAVGNPEGFGMAVTEGIISVDSERLDMTGSDGSAIDLRVMRVSAAINEGNSGGGLYDEDGKLIGIVCAKRIGADIDNMAYAIPVNLARNLAENIIDTCDGSTVMKVQRAFIGVEITANILGLVADPNTGELYRAECVEVGKVESTCVIKNEIRVGDIINSITVDGVTLNVTRVHHVTDHMLTARKGSEVSINVTRDGESFDIEFIVPASAIKAEK